MTSVISIISISPALVGDDHHAGSSVLDLVKLQPISFQVDAEVGGAFATIQLHSRNMRPTFWLKRHLCVQYRWFWGLVRGGDFVLLI